MAGAEKISITPDELIELEKLCDRSSLYDVMCALAAICHEKAEHIDQSYNNHPSADMWRKRALQVQGTAEYIERMENGLTPFKPYTTLRDRFKR